MGLDNLTKAYIADSITNKEKLKLRKPQVEKMRRDRINSSIEKLRKILEKEFPIQHPSSKLEKADVLEMAVIFLKTQMQIKAKVLVQSSSQQDYKEGYSTCLKATVNFISHPEVRKEIQMKMQNHFQQAAGITGHISPSESPVTSSPCQLLPQQSTLYTTTPVWRPWLN
ncbi:transcription factor HES-5-like [Protopterus annectens]|uniref:transcription factor HES-5-like n=1 Tax=Protopterus annectens TaxID=7888 RepID=UPI001CF974A8|nr:transcription factor HES-5-like [Protopterus annectens]